MTTPACRLRFDPSRPDAPWTPVLWWGRAGDPGSLEDAHAAIGEPDVFDVVVLQAGRRREVRAGLSLNDAGALGAELAGERA